MKTTHLKAALVLAAMMWSSLTVLAVEVPKELPRPNGKEADMSKPVKVFILMGQSNMVGAGKVPGADKDGTLEHAVKTKKLYPYLVDDAGNWTVRKDVRNVFVLCSGSGPWKAYRNEWMTISGNIGPEIGIGHYVGEVLDAPVLILKSCIGNRSLGYDLLPPSAEGYQGNKDDPTRTPKPGAWYAGVQYDGDTRAAKEVLKDLNTYYPGAKKFEVAGFFFWQGDKDRYSAALASSYEQNLVHFIKDLRKDFNAPDALFVCATLGQTKKGAGGNEGLILNAQLAVDGKTGKYPEFKGNVATFYSNPVSKGGASNGHYGGNAETYMNVGEGMGRAMAELLVDKMGSQVQGDPKDAAALADAEKQIAEKQYLKAVTTLRQLAAAKPGTDIAKQAADRLKALQEDPAIGQSIIDAEADAFEGRCVAAENSKDYVLAIKLYEQYVEQFSKASRLAKVKAHLESLKSDKAVQADVQSTKADTECKGWMSMADNFAKVGMNQKAREYLNKIIEKYGDTDWGAKARARLEEIPDR